MSKAIFTAAITGSIHTPTMSPYLPTTPDQIADNCIQAYEAGAAVAHVHVRNPETGQPSPEMELFKQVLQKVKSKCDMIIGTTRYIGAAEYDVDALGSAITISGTVVLNGKTYRLFS